MAPSGYLLDTNIVSALAPGRSPPSGAPDVAGWMDGASDRLWLSSVTIFEIRYGIRRLERAGGHGKAGRLAQWLGVIEGLYGTRILALDVPAAHRMADLRDLAQARGLAPGFADLAIAGLAVSRGLTVLTRNVSDFAPLDVPTWDPFQALPPEVG